MSGQVGANPSALISRIRRAWRAVCSLPERFFLNAEGQDLICSAEPIAVFGVRNAETNSL
jgi:hypothetical protein